MKNTGIIYNAICKINNKNYIGVTGNLLTERIKGHVKLSKKIHPKYIFHKAIKKYGICNFKFNEIDKYHSLDERDQKEIEYIKKYNSFYLNEVGYNMTYGGDGSKGHIKSPESIEKIKFARSKQIFSEETKKLWSLHRKGKKLNHGWKISKTAKETGSHKKSQETKEKIRNFLIGKSFEDRFGKEKSIEIRNKMSKSTKGKLNIKHTTKEQDDIIYNIYVNEKLGLNKLCKKIKSISWNIGHSTIKRKLIEMGVYNTNSLIRKNQYI